MGEISAADCQIIVVWMSQITAWYAADIPSTGYQHPQHCLS